MTRGFAKFATIFAALALPANAAQACWSERAAEAAQVRDMETMLMVSALRCRLSGSDILPAYNQFVRDSRSALTEANDVLRLHFAPKGGLNAYDRYVTSIANRYGAGVEGLACDDMASILSAAASERGSYDGLVRLAQASGAQPVLEGGVCPAQMATRLPYAR
jgi:hypothetical protein